MLWAYRTTTWIPIRETPFNLAFETEAVIPIEIDVPSAQVENFNIQSNSEELQANLDLLNEA